MNSGVKVLFLFLFAAFVVGSIVFPLDSTAQMDPDDLGVYLDANATISRGNVPSFTTDNELWIIGFGLAGDIAGFEFGLTFDPYIIVFGSEVLYPGAINLGPTPQNWIVGIGSCESGAGLVRLAKVTFGIFTSPLPPDMVVCLRPAAPSSFVPPGPGYLACNDDLIPFGVAQSGGSSYPDGCAVINPTIDCPPVPTVYHLDVPFVDGIPGMTVDMPIQLGRHFSKCSYVVHLVDHVAFRLTFDASVATFVSAAPAAIIAGWTVTSSTPQPGVVDIDLSGPTVDSGGSTPWVTVRFAMDLEGGTTPVTTSNEVVQVTLDTDPINWDVVGSVGGIGESTVAAERVSFGAVKARFGSER